MKSILWIPLGLIVAAIAAAIAIPVLERFQSAISAPGDPRKVSGSVTEITFIEYSEKLKELEDDPAQKETFHNSLRGKKVRWTGYVSDVVKVTDEIMTLRLTPTDTLQRTVSAYVNYDAKIWRTTLKYLKRHQKVNVEAYFESGGFFVTLYGVTITAARE